jgi:ssDNA-binding replication factor A large subunit
MSTESTQSTTREAQTTTTGGNTLTACAAINSADTWLDLEAKVLELWEPTSTSVAQVGLLGDSSGVMKFVSWETSNVPQIEEGASYALETVVTDEYDGQFSVHLNSETSVAEITGAAAERERLAADVLDAVALGTIDTADKWVDVQVEVDQLWEPTSGSIAQVGLLADTTGRIKFVSWETSDLPKLDEGETYSLDNVVTDEYDGRYSVKLNAKTEIKHLDGGFASVR